MEGLYVDIRSLLDETTQERYHERIGGEYMGKSGVINQDFKGEDNTAYHDVIRLFKIYRSVNWRMQIEYYGAAEPPVRCGESHLSGLTEPPHFVY